MKMPRRPAREGRGSLRLHPGDVLLAVVSYLPLLLTHRGKLGADTKAYLYLDPGKLLSKAPYLWDPSVGLGTVTHQNIGYLLPMGPYYWLMQLLGVPDWIAQRIWFGSIIFLAGLGVRYLLRSIRWTAPGGTVAALGYALSPYVLHYIYKHSVILLPFTALPWLIAFTARSLRHRGWRATRRCSRSRHCCREGSTPPRSRWSCSARCCGCCTRCSSTASSGSATRWRPYCASPRSRP
ncbi:MAG: alpha-(1-_3)-arabinofuranosyltransferase family protein [Microthrixaceae bacterium]